MGDWATAEYKVTERYGQTLAAVTLGGLSRCFLSKQRAYNAVVCDRSSCSHTTLLQRFVLGARVFKKP